MSKLLENRKKQRIEMFICFAVAIIDMFFLKDVIHQMQPSISGTLSGAFAFALALLADYMAYDWGKKKGKRESGATSLSMWIFLGVVYLALRCVSVYFDIIKPENYSVGAIAFQIFAICYLTASYLITGFVLREQSAKYWDINITNYLDAKEEFDEENKINSKNEASLKKMVETLEGYDKNYDLLNEQYLKNKNSIRKEEESIMAQIVSKIVAEHDINPDHAKSVMEGVLRERDLKNEQAHQSQA